MEKFVSYQLPFIQSLAHLLKFLALYELVYFQLLGSQEPFLFLIGFRWLSSLPFRLLLSI